MTTRVHTPTETTTRERPQPEPEPAPASATDAPPVVTRASRYRVALVGPEAWRKRLERAMAALPATKVVAPTPRQLPRAIPELRGAIITMSREYSMKEGVARLHGRVAPVPVVAVVPTETQKGAIAQMFERGAAAVVAWPEETFLLAPIMAAVSAREGSAPFARVDEALAHGVRLRLAIQFEDTGVGVDVEGRVCTLRATVPSLLEKMELVSLVEAVPGVEDVRSEDIVVDGAAVDRSELTDDVRTALRLTDGIDSMTLCAVADDAGVVTVAGTTANERERNLVRRVIANVPGVRGIEDLSTLSPPQKGEDRRHQRRAELAVQNVLTSQSDLRVSIFGPIGFVTGRVGNANERDAVEQAILRETAVHRVINEVEVRP